MASPFISSGIGALNSHSFVAEMAEVRQQTWDGLHVSPRTAPSKGAKLCIYHHWLGRPSKVCCEPYYELPMSITRLRALVQFRVGPHSLPVEQGRFVRPSFPRHLRRCNLCSTRAVGDELHYILTALALMPSGLSIPTSFRMLQAPCACSCGTKTKRLSAIASQPFCKWLRHEHRSLLISQAG